MCSWTERILKNRLLSSLEQKPSVRLELEIPCGVLSESVFLAAFKNAFLNRINSG